MTTARSFICLTIIVSCLVNTPNRTVRGAKVLFYPSNINSHFVYFGQLAQALSQEGHSTSLLAPSNAKVPGSLLPNVKVITYSVQSEVPYYSSPKCSSLFVRSALAETFSEWMEPLVQLGYDMEAAFGEDCEALLQNDEIMRKLFKANFDLVIVDTVSFTCGYTLPYKLNIPYASFSIPFSMWMMKVPAVPSFVPSIMTAYTDHMTFLERLGNVFFQLMDYSYLNTTDHFSRVYVPEKPPLSPLKLMQGSSLFFVLSDLTVSYPAPTMPNILHIGDIMARPAQPLPDDLKRYMDDNKVGVILISFGSFVDHLPADVTCKISNALSRLPYSTIWRVKKETLTCDVPSNVKVMPWIPQNDLLGHPNLKLFISHCGLNSIIEAVYHAVPLLACPLTLDQPFNARVVETHGYGQKLDFKSFTEDELVGRVKTILTDSSFKEKISKASNMLKDRPQTPAKRASFWIHHVVKNGADHLRTNAFELTDVEFFMLDVYAFIAAVFLSLIFAFLCCCKLTYKICCAKLCRVSKSKQE